MLRKYGLVVLMLLAASLLGVAEAKDLKTVQAEDKVLGHPRAKVTLIEYASLSCHHCGDFHTNVLPIIEKEYIETGKVKWVFRDFPLNGPALAAAKLAHCAGKQNKDSYFSALKKLFAEQKNWAFNENFKTHLEEIAKTFGIDAAAYAACLEDPALETQVLTSRKEAADTLDVKSTPTFFINGEKAQFRTVEDARKALNTVLSGKTLGQEAKDKAKKLLLAQPDDQVLGKPKAKLTIIEYVNIGCPHCGEFHNMLIETLRKDYIDSGKVKLVFREFPMSPPAFHAYMLANCRGKESFFDTISLLIQEGSTWTGEQVFFGPLRAIAEKAGMTKEAFYACMENQEVATRVANRMRDGAEALGIHHSPTLFIQGEQAENLNSPETIRQAVDAALAKKRSLW